MTDTLAHVPAPAQDAGTPVPATVRIDGESWRVSRAWPGKKGTVDVELVPRKKKTKRTLRAGRLDGEALTVFPQGTDPKLPGLAPAAKGARLVSHRPGKRAVVQVSGESPGEGDFLKIVRPGRAHDIVAGLQHSAAFAETFRMPELVEATEDHVRFTLLKGASLHDPRAISPADDLGAWTRAWTQILDAWSRAGKVESNGHMPLHTPADECAVVCRWLTLADGYVPDSVTNLVDRGAEACSLLLKGDGGAASARMRPVHRDLHDKQLLWDPELGPGLLDVDTACLAEPEVDLANLAVHARWRAIQGVYTEAEAAVVTRLVDDLVESTPTLDLTRFDAYAAATRVRLACVYAFRPAYRDLVGRLWEKAFTGTPPPGPAATRPSS